MRVCVCVCVCACACVELGMLHFLPSSSLSVTSSLNPEHIHSFAPDNALPSVTFLYILFGVASAVR